LNRGDLLQNPFLFDGDSIRISKASGTPPDFLAISATNIAPQFIKVNMIGKVKKEGPLDLPANTPLTKAVLMAGGVLPLKANSSNVQLLRVNRDGSAVRRRYALDYSQGISDASNPPLQNGDTVLVGTSGFGVLTASLDQVIAPITAAGSVFAIFTLLNP